MPLRLRRLRSRLRRRLLCLATGLDARVRAASLRRQEGQTTVEYALVMLGVAAIAGLLLAWIRGTDLFDKLFDKILKSVTP